MSNCIKCGIEVITGALMCMSCAGEQEFADPPLRNVCGDCGSAFYPEHGCVCQNDEKRVMENEYHKAKFDLGKPRFDLIDPVFEEDLAKVMNHGANLHGSDTWQSVPNAVERYYAAIRRHLNAIRKGELTDPDSKLPHTAHITANAMFLSVLLMEDNVSSSGDFATLTIERGVKT